MEFGQSWAGPLLRHLSGHTFNRMRKIGEQFNLNTVISLLLTTAMTIVGYFANRTLIQIDNQLSELRQLAAADHDRIARVEAIVGIIEPVIKHLPAPATKP